MPHRLAILADLHFSTPDNQFPGQDLSYARTIVARAVAMILEELPERLLIVGDLTNFGTAEEYGALHEVFAPFRGRIDAVAGNHENVRAGLEEFERQMGRPRARADEWAGIPRLLLNTAIDRQDPHYWHGLLDEPSLRLIEHMPMDGPLIVAMHHPIRGTVRDDTGHPMMACLNGHLLRDRLRQRRGASVLFTGHTHLPDLTMETTTAGRITYVAVPPLCFWPHAYLAAEWSAPHLLLAVRRVIVDPGASPDPDAREVAAREHREPPVESISLRLR
jgi:predicted phosphodiesterase